MKTVKNISLRIILLLSAGIICSCAPAANNTTKTGRETKEQRDERMRWWREARFGMFIHWGLYSIPAGEWKGKQVPGIGEWIMNNAEIPVAEYADLAKQFNPVKFNAEEWVKLAKEARMKYIVITSKYHDGFAMFKSKASPYNIVDATPFKRDVLKELFEACRKHNIKLGFYYSQAQDWHHPGAAAIRVNNRKTDHWDKAQDGDIDKYIDEVAIPQVREILSNYGPIAVLWWDTPTGMTRQQAEKLAPLVKLQPGIITNNRLGYGFEGNTETPEQFIPATGFPGRDWETCMTMNDTWGYKKNDNNWKSTGELIRNLADIASKGGNYLLNVGPTSEGLIPQPSVERLKEIGQWMKVNGESIYGTGPSVFKNLSWGRCTTKPGKLYLHIFNWPADNKLKVPGLENKIAKTYLLADKKQKGLMVSRDENNVIIDLPNQSPDEIDSVVVVEIEGEPKILTAVLKQKEDGSIELKAIDAIIFGSTARYESGGGKDNIGYWTNPSDYVSWDFMVVKPGNFNVEITYACDKGVGGSEYSIEVDGQELTGKITDTESWTNFKKENIGSVKFDKEAKYTLLVKPKTMPGFAVMNLKSIMLKPADVN